MLGPECFKMNILTLQQQLEPQQNADCAKLKDALLQQCAWGSGRGWWCTRQKPESLAEHFLGTREASGTYPSPGGGVSPMLRGRHKRALFYQLDRRAAAGFNLREAYLCL